MTPYIIYILSFLGVLIVYSLGWSQIYPTLSVSLILFLIGTFIIAYIFHRKSCSKKSEYIKSNYEKYIKYSLIIEFLGFVLDFIYAGRIPALGGTQGYLGFEGIPVVHVLLYTFNIFISIYIFKVFLDNMDKKILFLWILTFIPALLLVSRGMIVNIAIGCFFIVLIKFGLNIKVIRKFFVIGISVILLFFYAFGILGNIRNNTINKSEDKYSSLYIMEVGGASDKFRNSIIPKPFFWAYTYIASPLANLQLNINEYDVNYSFENFKKFSIKEILPDFISKRIVNEEYLKLEQPRPLIAPTLTVATFYIGAYNYVGWIGMSFIFMFLMIAIYIYDKLISNENPFKIISMAMLCSVIVLCTFDNMISYSGMSFQLVYPLIWEVYNIYNKKMNRVNKSDITDFDSTDIKVLLVNRKDAYDRFGGDTVQMCNTQKELIKLGVNCEIALGEQEEDAYLKYDIIHIFNIQTENFTLKEAKKVKKLSKRLVISPIWWNYQKLMNDIDDNQCSKKVKIVRRIFGKKFVILLKEIKEYFRNIKRKKILDIADIILPNSNLEVDALKDTFNKDYKNKCHVVYNGVEDKFINSDGIKFNNELIKLGLKEYSYVTQVGRGEIEKNTLYTIKACNSLNIPLVIVGQFTDSAYEELCRNEATNGRVYFLGRKNTEEVIEINKYSKAHILPSYRETPGLSSLEAAALGCNIVTTIVGSTEEYFKDFVYYCNPNDYDSIKNSIKEAWENERDNRLSKFIAMRYTWKIAAEQTKASYEVVLNRRID